MSEFEITDNGEYLVSSDDMDVDVMKQFNLETRIYSEWACDQPFSRNRIVFFNLHASYQTTTLRLCNVFKWCKHSKAGRRLESVDSMHAVGIDTYFRGGLVMARAIADSDKCSIFFTTVNRSLQINVKRKKMFTGACLIGVCVASPKVCHQCAVPASLSVKLKMCSRCFQKVDRVRVYYCSQLCQCLDYNERHRFACNYDWGSDDWLGHGIIEQ